MNSEETIMGMMDGMNAWELKQLVLRMSESLGKDACLDLVKDAVSCDISCDTNTVMEKVHAALASKESKFFDGPRKNEVINCRSTTDYAYMLMSEAVRDGCINDVSSLVKLGRTEDAEKYVRAISAGLETARCAMTEHAPSSGAEMSGWFLYCLEKGDILGGFDY